MKNMKMVIMTSMVLVVLASGLSFGEAEKETGELKFISSKETPKYIESTHGAEFVVNYDFYPDLKSIIATEIYKTMSDRQKEYLQGQLYLVKKRETTTIRVQRSPRVSTVLTQIGDRNQLYRWSVVAVSEDDVKKMVKAFLEVARQNRIKGIQRYKDAIKECSGEIDELQVKIDEYEKQVKPYHQKYEALKNELNPSLLNGNQGIIKIHDQLDEYKIIWAGNGSRQLAIDIAQQKFRAKMDAAGTVERQAINALILKYDEMKADLEIERAGIRAEMETLEVRRSKVKTYFALISKLSWLEKKIDGFNDELRSVEKSHQSHVGHLKTSESQPVDIYDNEVVVMELKSE